MVLSLLKGLDYEEAAMLALALAAVLPSRRRFHRRAPLLDEPFTPGWVVAVGVVMVGAVGVGLFAYKYVSYAPELWWRMDPAGDAPRFLRASLGAVVAIVGYGVAHLLHPGLPEPRAPTPAELADARRIVALSPRPEANAALLGDKSLMFNAQRTAFLMYGTTPRAWVALGDPVGPAADLEELAWRFREEADRRGLWPVFYHAGDALCPTLVEMSLPAFRIGEEAVVRLESFSLDDEPRQRLRRAFLDLRRRGLTAEVVPPADVPALLPELKRISDAWLARRSTRERGFSMGRFDPEYLSTLPHVVARLHGRLVAFATVWPGAPGTELAVDLVRHSREAPPNVLELLLVELILWGKAQGYREVNLGMAPLEEEPGARAPSWNRLGALVFRHGEHFPSIHRLRRFKERFGVEWRPRYLAAPDAAPLPRVIATIAGLIAGEKEPKASRRAHGGTRRPEPV
jgi:phosphatidylglycerol lysyltransferase